MASRKLWHYFQAYHIIIPSSQPLKDIMRNREATGRIGKWAAELNEFSIDYVLLGSCFGAPKVSHEEAASAEVVSKRWPKVPFHGASAF
jgi:hypothetical protein